ncbi:MAG: 3-deoxy-7-phosphoheptulonate synthase [Dehalococcoidales bacterium]|nr:3-deoxy-7-phosphoheptulonate synthase [Dehalococcoidales bacterium]
MIIMKKDATQEQVDQVVKEVKKRGLRVDVSKGRYKTIIGLIGDERKIPFDSLVALPGVKDAVRVETRYKLISREYTRFSEGVSKRRVINVGNVAIGGDEPIIIAGPCAVESKKQLFRIAEEAKKAGAHILRGGIFKPRSSVYSFQGLGAEGWEGAVGASQWLREAGRQFDMPVVTEVRGEAQVDLVAEYADILQIGARNMYNQDLLTKVAKKKKPVLFKRHFGAGIEEFLSFAEYIAAGGNKDIILCERGIIPIGKGREYTRYTLDLASVPAIQKETYLPVFVDPSHATGRRDLIFNMSCAAVAAGASGLMIEVHYNPAEALVDGPQALTPDELKNIIDTCKEVQKLVASRKAEAKALS